MIKISRWYQPDCTLGRLTFDKFQCFTLELKDLNNASNISCIPEGIYTAFKRNSPTNGKCIEFEKVPNRTNIQIHSGNYTKNILGCVLVGDSIKFIDGDTIPDVSNSRVTLDKLLDLLPNTFSVEIKGK